MLALLGAAVLELSRCSIPDDETSIDLLNVHRGPEGAYGRG